MQKYKKTISHTNPTPTPTSVLPVRFLSPPPSPTVSSPNGATTDQHRRNPTSKNHVHKYQNRFLTEKLREYITLVFNHLQNK